MLVIAVAGFIAGGWWVRAAEERRLSSRIDPLGAAISPVSQAR